MTPRAPALAAALLGAAVAASAEPPQAATTGKPFGMKYIGQGGSNELPNREASDYLENGPRHGPDAPRPADNASPDVGRHGALPGARPAAPRPSKEEAASQKPPPQIARTSPRRSSPQSAPAAAPAAPPAAQSEPRRDARYSLWEGISAPLELPAEQLSQMPEEQASSLVRGEYERRLLGAEPIATASGKAPESAPGLVTRSATPGGELFVAIEFKGAEHELKDAVAGLQGVAGFRADTRFVPTPSERPGGRGRMIVRGWLPSSQIGAAMQSPAVGRLELEPRRAASGAASTVKMMLGVRIPREGSAASAFERVIGDLSRRASFRWTRTIGYQPVPRSEELALVVVGELPLRELGKLMQHPSVVKVAPAPPEEPPASAPAGPAGNGHPEAGRHAALPGGSFLAFVRTKAPLLIVATLLLLGVSFAGFLKRAGKVFIPYRR